MAKRRSKIKIGGKAPLRACSGKGLVKSSSRVRKLSSDLDSNSFKSSDGKCTEESLHQEKVQVDYVIDTKTATAESSEEHLITSEQSSEKEKCLETNMKKSTNIRGKVSTNDKTLGTNPREIDGETCLDVECGENLAIMHLSKLCVGSKGACIDFKGSWLTPNEFQFVSGRETAKDWKRSIRHNGFSLKHLIVNGHIELNTSPPPSLAPTTPTTPTPIPVTSTPTASVVQNKRGTKRSDSVAKDEPTPAEASGNKRIYIPVKRRNGAKVGGRRRKVKARKRVEPRRPARRPVVESPKPDVQDSDKDSIETTPRPSEILEPDVTNSKEEEMEEKESEEFFKLLNLSKTNGKGTTPPPVDIPKIIEADSKPTDDVDINKNTKMESGEKASAEVVETFRSRLIPDETGLRIAINRQVVCMKEKESEANMINETLEAEDSTNETVQPELDDTQATDTGDKLTDDDETCPDDAKVTVKTEPIDEAVSLKTDIPTIEESICFVPKIDTKDVENVESASNDKIANSKAIDSKHTIDAICLKMQNSKAKDISGCTKCVDNDEQGLSDKSKSESAEIHTNTSHYSQNIISDCKNSVGVPPQLLCTNSKPYGTMCECKELGCKERSHKSTLKPSKPTTSDSAILHGKVPESRVTIPIPVNDQTCHEKSKYESDMLDLMSMYRPVMMPCDGICPYVCPDPATALRSYGDSPLPYGSCNSPKWPQSFPLLSGVMTPEMMLYMTQQLYYDMYNNSLFAQCTSSDKVSQSKPVKRKEPEHDPDTPLDLTVKRTKHEQISTQQCVTSMSDAPLDFSRKSNHTLDKKTSSIPTHTNTHSHTHQQKVSNGHFKSHGYNGAHRLHSQQPRTPRCTCGRKEDLRTWNVDKVCSFLKQYNGCAAYTKTFREQGIDGRLLPYLTMQHLTRTLGMQTRPALTFLDAVDQHLKAGNNTRRYCETCKA